MEALAKLEEERGNYLPKEGDIKESGPRQKKERPASNEMCTFLVLNISSLQLIPVNIIAYRSQYGSISPAAVIGPGLFATAISTAAAVLFCKVMQISKNKQERGA